MHQGFKTLPTLSAASVLLIAQHQAALAQATDENRSPPIMLAAASPVVVEVNADKVGPGRERLSKLGAQLDLPQSATVVDAAMMRSQGASSLASALRSVPGLTLGAAEGGQIGSNINLNGFSARTDLYLDGARDRAQYYRDVFALDAVEVLMGPSSMLFGRGSTGGTINQVTRKPVLGKDMTEVQASVTSNGLVRTVVDHNAALSDAMAWRVAAMAQHGAASARDQTDLSDFGLAPSLTLQWSASTRLTVSALLQHNRDQVDYGVPNLNGAPALPRTSAAYGDDADRTVSDIANLALHLKHKVNDGLSLQQHLRLESIRTDARETAPNTLGTLNAQGAFQPLLALGGNDPKPISSTLAWDQLWVRKQSHDRVIHDQGWSSQSEARWRFERNSIAHDVLAGVELAHDSYDNRNYFRNGSCNGYALNPVGGTSGFESCVSLTHPELSSGLPGAPVSTGNHAHGDASTTALYINDNVTLGEHFKWVIGARRDRFAASIANSLVNANTPARADQTVYDTSVRHGLIWEPNQDTSYYLSYSTSFNPSLEQLVGTTGGTAPLPPQSNHAYEIGAKWQQAQLLWTTALFDITQDNARAQDISGTYTATGTVEVKGARAGVNGRVNQNWQLYAAYTYLDARIIHAVAPGTDQRTPANTPRHSAALWSLYRIRPQWEAGGGWIVASRRFANNTDLVSVPSYVRTDAVLTYYGSNFEASLHVNNVFNRVYYDALIPSDGGRAVPGTTRSYALSLSYHF